MAQTLIQVKDLKKYYNGGDVNVRQFLQKQYTFSDS